MGTILYFDMFSGISGDMCAGAFLDLGLDRRELDDVLSRLPLAEEFSLFSERKSCCGIQGTAFTVRAAPDPGHHHRTMKDIREMITGSVLPPRTSKHAIEIFETLARAEGAVHSMPPDDVHFHEVGAVDSIVDIVTAAFAAEYFDADECASSPFCFGSGTVDTSHGRLPVPAPAVVEITRGCPAAFTGIPMEITTPTGAAIIRTLVPHPGTPPSMFTVSGSGYGFGTRDTGRGPNALRILAGTRSDEASLVTVLETDIDDCSPEILGHACALIMSAGALDCTITPLLMKKGRPGHRLTVLCRPADREAMKKLIFSQTTTFGIRERDMLRTVLRRESVTVTVAGAEVSCKTGFLGSEQMTVSPEYEDCSRAAERTGLPLKEIYRLALAEARRRTGADGKGKHTS